jgi:hypothetical protein
MTDTQTTIFSVFAAAILTAAGARLIAGFQANRDAKQWELDRAHERKQARMADERLLPDSKRERLRATTSQSRMRLRQSGMPRWGSLCSLAARRGEAGRAVE